MVLERRNRKLHGRLWDYETRNRILKSCLWVLAGAALVGVLVFMIAVAPSLLIGTPPKGLSAADELKARNDVRATLVQGLAGLAVAGGLVVTYRTYRQNRAEQDPMPWALGGSDAGPHRLLITLGDLSWSA